MAKAHDIDMLHGPLTGKLLLFALPFAASSILQQLFSTVDIVVVGQFVGSIALAAVGANTFLINLMINFFVGISLGANVVIANHIGQGDEKKISGAIATSMLLSLTAGVVLLIVGILISRSVLQWMDTPQEVLPQALVFLRIYLLGAPFLLVYNFGASILRSHGDTRRPLYILLIAGSINVALNLILVIVFHLGVAGAAISTDISNVCSALMVVRLLLKEPAPFRLDIRKARFDAHELSRILQIGVPAGVQSMVFSLSNIFVQTAINGYGAAAMAGASVAQNFDSYCFFLLTSFSGAAVTFISQNYGAGDIQRCRRVFWLCMAFGAGSCFAANMLFYLNSGFFLSLFTNDASVLYYAKVRMGYVLLFQSVAASYEITAAAMRGMGHSTPPALITIVGTCVFRLAWIFFVCPLKPGYDNLMVVYPLSWVITGVVMIVAFIYYSRKAVAFIRQ